jgi:dTDP-4-dehydrorhamnose reductase
MILLLGGTGYVGEAFQKLLNARGIVFTNVSRRDCDYTSPEILRELIRKTKPQFLINSAGYTGRPNVDGCEKDKENCLLGNAVLPGVIARVCAAEKLPWGHVSSGCIYTGTRPDGSGFREIDVPNFSFRTNNCSFYSGSKALGEEILLDFPECYVWRLRMPFNELDGSRNYITKLMRYEKIIDFTNSLSQLDEFVRACWETWEHRVPFGIYNVVNPGPVTTRGVVERMLKWGIGRKEYQFFADETEFMKTAAKAPRSNCVLDGAKLAQCGIKMSDGYEAVERALKHWVKE